MELVPVLRLIAQCPVLSVRDLCSMWGTCRSWKEEMEPVFRLVHKMRSRKENSNSKVPLIYDTSIEEHTLSWYRHQLALEEVLLHSGSFGKEDASPTFRCTYVDANWDYARYDRHSLGCNFVMWGHTLVFPVPCPPEHLHAALPALFASLYTASDEEQYGRLVEVSPASAFRRIGHSIVKSKSGFDEARFPQKVMVLRDLCKYLEASHINVRGVEKVLDKVLGDHGKDLKEGKVIAGIAFQYHPHRVLISNNRGTNIYSATIDIYVSAFMHDMESVILDPSEYHAKQTEAFKNELRPMAGILPLAKQAFRKHLITRRTVQVKSGESTSFHEDEQCGERTGKPCWNSSCCGSGMCSSDAQMATTGGVHTSEIEVGTGGEVGTWEGGVSTNGSEIGATGSEGSASCSQASSTESGVAIGETTTHASDVKEPRLGSATGSEGESLHIYILESFDLLDQLYYQSQDSKVVSLTPEGISLSNGASFRCLAYLGTFTGVFECTLPAQTGPPPHRSCGKKFRFPVLIFHNSMKMRVERISGRLDIPTSTIIEFRTLVDGIDYHFPTSRAVSADSEGETEGKYLSFYADARDEDWLSYRWTRHIIIVDHRTQRGWGMAWGWSD